jgi:hypothetical protein
MFMTERTTLARMLPTLRKKLSPEAAIWVSWPKKSSKAPSDITEDTIREIALSLGLVDIKCARSPRCGLDSSLWCAGSCGGRKAIAATARRRRTLCLYRGFARLTNRCR